MLIALDAGNSRLKWGLHDGAQWIEHGALPTSDAARLGETARGWPRGADCVACNVAGTTIEAIIKRSLSTHGLTPRWLRPSATACGVRNSYEQPERLGADRWAALIGARSLTSGDCLVVCAGTATTVDWLDAAGTFQGGLILPGIDLMLASLARNTAQLPLAEGSLRTAPRNTMDAIVSGCLNAQAGAIERMFRPLPASALCLLTGGAAARISDALTIPHQIKDTLILEGLRRFALSR
ncbi:type III pantothenate kinase [Propionivibrio limicola]|uniref:type III pantothenate kinase n=1 Tax=Propionivibrio limicola TaxID=167645 RepID=UPI001291F3A4|nr:type III pantothenate kinase [Propionivibrio limicola]